MKKSLLVAAVAISALFAGGAAMAQDAGSLSYNVEVTNNYVFRGITQTNGDAALQGGVDYKKGTFYMGTWLSNVDFGPNTTNTEWDVYMGLQPTVGNYSFDFGVIYYVYPDECSGCDFTVGELKTAVSHPMGKGTIGFAMYTPVKQLEHPYYEINASYPLTDKLSISGALANNEANIAEAGGLAYSTSNIGLTYAINNTLSIDLRQTAASKEATGRSLSNTIVTLKAGF